MNLDQLVAEAKERCHRSIGQRARWAKHDFLEGLLAPRQRDLVPLPTVRIFADIYCRETIDVPAPWMSRTITGR